MSQKTEKTMSKKSIITETWKPIVGYEGIYEISNDGNVKRISRHDKTWKHIGVIKC